MIPEDFPEGCYLFPNNLLVGQHLGYGDESLLDVKHTIRSRPTGCDMRITPVAGCIAMVGQSCYVAAKCGCNLHNALCNRHGKHQPPFSGDFASWISCVDSLYVDYLLMFDQTLNRLCTTWIERWPLWKRLAIIKSELTEVSRPDLITVMTKMEVSVKPLKKARNIQWYVNYCTQSEFAPVVVALQKTLTAMFYRAPSSGRVRVTFGSGLNAKALGAWMTSVMLDRPTYWIYERDGASWDACMQRGHHDMVLSVYGRFTDVAFLQFIDKAFTVRCRKDTGHGLLDYTLVGTCKSGHNDTTLSNTLKNAGIAYAVAQDMGLDCDIIIVGDDLLLISSDDFDEHEFARRESSFGIVPEYKKLRSYEDCTFISGLWAPCVGGLAFIPKPGRLIAKLFWSVKFPSAKMRDQHVRTIIQGHLPVCSGLPVVGAFLRANDVVVNLYRKLVMKWKQYCFQHYESEIVWDDLVIRKFFCHRYGITFADIDLVEDFLVDNAGHIGLIVHPVLTRIMEVDLCSLEDRDLLY